MATIAQKRNRKLWFLVLVIVAVMLLTACGVPIPVSVPGQVLPLPGLNDHAREKHGQEANKAWNYINSLPVRDYCKWTCPDQRTRYVCNVRGSNDWAVAVLEGGVLITSFIANQEYARGVIDTLGCKNPWRMSHP
jgi:hypothetical protein